MAFIAPEKIEEFAKHKHNILVIGLYVAATSFVILALAIIILDFTVHKQQLVLAHFKTAFFFVLNTALGFFLGKILEK